MRVRNRPVVISILEQLELVARACSRVRRLDLSSGCPTLRMDVVTKGASDTAASATEAASSIAPVIPAVSIPSPPTSSGISSSSSSFSSSSPSTSCKTQQFSQLICLKLGAFANPNDRVSWNSAALRTLTGILHAASLQWLLLWYVPFRHIHHLRTLSHLRGLKLLGDQLPATFITKYFAADSRTRGTQRSDSFEETSREMGNIANEQLEQELLAAVQHGTVMESFAKHSFIASADGREAFFEAVLREKDNKKYRADSSRLGGGVVKKRRAPSEAEESEDESAE